MSRKQTVCVRRKRFLVDRKGAPRGASNAGWRLIDLAAAVQKPEGGRYSVGYFSRLERGSTMAPLYVYVAVACALDVDPGRLLGPDTAQLQVGDEEMMLVKMLRKLRIDPAEAIARIITPAPRL